MFHKMSYNYFDRIYLTFKNVSLYWSDSLHKKIKNSKYNSF